MARKWFWPLTVPHLEFPELLGCLGSFWRGEAGANW